MDAGKVIPRSVDEYIAGFPPDVRKVLEALRRTIRKAAPQAEERISYRMPAFADHGILVWFAAHRSHVGFYPTASGIRAFRRELAKYEVSKGTVRFPLDKPLPLALIARIVRFRVDANKKARADRGEPAPRRII
jgi:uncharacterized protein YdhG (YjbR/CyaY superfamily)